LPSPLAVLVVKKLGWRRGLDALTFLTAWGIASDSLGHPVRMTEYAEYWGQSLAKSYKEREAFFLMWPDEASPERLWGLARSAVSSSLPKEVAVAQVSAVKV